MSEATANGGAASHGTASNGAASGRAANGSRAASAAHDGAADEATRRPASLTLVPAADEKLTTRAFKSDQEVRWCPGCGYYPILAPFHPSLPQPPIPPE